MQQPRVSVIVPVYNGAPFLAEAINSALAQSFRDFEIIIVDDGSTDDSAAIADEFARRHPECIRVIRQANGGICPARNAALNAARAELIALLDCDDAWLPHHLSDSVRELDRHPDVGLVHANYSLMDGSSNDLGVVQGRWLKPSPSTWEAIFLRQEHVMCVTAVFRRTLCDQGFDMRFNHLGCEDRDLWLRIAEVANVAYLHDVHARYRLHSNNMSKQIDRMVQARLRLVEKHSASERGKALRSKALAAVHADVAYGWRTEGKFGRALKAYGLAWSHNPWSWRILKGALGAAIARR